MCLLLSGPVCQVKYASSMSIAREMESRARVRSGLRTSSRCPLMSSRGRCGSGGWVGCGHPYVHIRMGYVRHGIPGPLRRARLPTTDGRGHLGAQIFALVRMSATVELKHISGP